MFRISVAGHLGVDLTPDLGPTARFAPGQLIGVGPMTVRLGGSVPNSGLTLLELGASPELQAVVGDDHLGGLVRDLLEGVPCRVTRVAGATTSYSIVLEPGGADRTFWHHTGVNDHFDPGSVSIETDLLHVGYPSLLPGALADGGAAWESLFRRAKANGVTTSLDLADTDPDGPAGSYDWEGFFTRVLPGVDVASPSVDDLRSAMRDGRDASLVLAREYAEWLLARGVAVALVTAGGDGLVIRAASRERLAEGGRVLAAVAGTWADADLELPALTLTGVVTSTGAGDSATAGLLYALAAGLNPDEGARLARAAAAARMTGRPVSEVEGGS